METTKPSGSLDAVEDLIFEPQPNPEPEAEETVEATEDLQTEAVEEAEIVEDVDEVSDIDEEPTDTEDVLEDDAAVPLELTDDLVIEYKSDGEIRSKTLGELKQSAAGQDYIQKGMADNATLRKELEAAKDEFAREKAAVSEERQALMTMAQQMQSGNIPPLPEYPSEELKQSDPVGWNLAAEEYRHAVDVRNRWENNVKAMAERDAIEKQNAEKAFLSEQAMRLTDWMPEFKDPEKRSAFIQDMSNKAKKHYNLTDEQMRSVKTADEVMILTDALKYRELKANQSAAKAKAKGARPTVNKPGARKSNIASRASRAKEARANMSKSGSIDDVAKFLLNS